MTEQLPKTVTKQQVMNAIRNHGYDLKDVADFLAVCGNKETYSTQALRDWLGY